ncbi:hypothetical protein NEF87_003457 [Candidatus Lokiarchaeum ossiferum]|uniref:Uncharacterized protein n=1 Tax=Candidatus Lokiarchaeum ossiferum TaxID=2951803 RepID=A0ABY6HWD9_9ARCH|nr:hypothetical protein NEF87_003457 [Candidatus Lokiarchaeum sp. B-35]
MGQKLMKYYQYIKDEKGYEGKVELAKKTMINSLIAANVEDSDQNIAKFKEAIQKITGKAAPIY